MREFEIPTNILSTIPSWCPFRRGVFLSGEDNIIL
jgi:hypothetical protein